jgi:hypothetical protein
MDSIAVVRTQWLVGSDDSPYRVTASYGSESQMELAQGQVGHVRAIDHAARAALTG